MVGGMLQAASHICCATMANLVIGSCSLCILSKICKYSIGRALTGSVVYACMRNIVWHELIQYLDLAAYDMRLGKITAGTTQTLMTESVYRNALVLAVSSVISVTSVMTSSASRTQLRRKQKHSIVILRKMMELLRYKIWSTLRTA